MEITLEHTYCWHATIESSKYDYCHINTVYNKEIIINNKFIIKLKR